MPTAQLCLVSFRQTKSASGRCWSVFLSPRLFSLVGLFLARLWPNRCYGSNCSIMATSAMSGIATWSWHPDMFGATVFGFVQALGWCKWMGSWWIKFYSFSWVWSWRNVKIQIHPSFFFEKLLEAPFGVHCVFLLTTTATVFLWGPKLGAWSELAMIEISLGFKACHLISKLVF